MKDDVFEFQNNKALFCGVPSDYPHGNRIIAVHKSSGALLWEN